MRPLLLTIALVTFAAGLIGQFVIQGVPLFLRTAGVGSEAVALVYFAATPFALRFLWAPLVDRHGTRRFGRFGTWIVGSQCVVCLCLFGLALIEPASSLVVLACLLTLTMTALATQLTAVGGMMVERFDATCYPQAASTQAAAGALSGVALGSGVLYLLGDLGWQVVVVTLATLSVGLLIIAVGWLELDRASISVAARASIFGQLAVFGRAAPRQLFVLTLLVNSALVLPYTLKAVILVDAGFSVTDVGLIGIVAGNVAGFAGALLMRPVVERVGGLRVLALLGTVNATFVILLAWFATDGLGATEAIVLVVSACALAFAGFTASRALLLPLCERGRQATDLAAFVSLESIGLLVFAGLGSRYLDSIGLSSLLVIGGLLSALGALRSWQRHRRFALLLEQQGSSIG